MTNILKYKIIKVHHDISKVFDAFCYLIEKNVENKIKK